MKPAPDERPQPVRVDGSGRASRGAEWAVAVAVVFLVLALAKPWGSSGTGGSPASPLATTSPTIGIALASPSSTDTWPWDPNATTCLGPSGLVLVTLVRWPGHEVRTWQPATAALSVEQAAVAAAPIVVRSSHIVGIGICRIETRSGSASTSAAEIVDVVQLGAGAPPGARRDLGMPSRISVDQPTPYLGILFRPPPSPAGNAGSTPTGGPLPLPPLASGNLLSPDAVVTRPAAPSEDSASWTPGSYALGIQFPSRGPTSPLWVAVTIVPATGEPT